MTAKAIFANDPAAERTARGARRTDQRDVMRGIDRVGDTGRDQPARHAVMPIDELTAAA